MHPGFVTLFLTIALESRSRNDSRRDIQNKVNEWLEAGVKVVLDQDLATRTIFAHRRGREPERFGADDTLVLEDVFPDFSAPVERLFPSRRP